MKKAISPFLICIAFYSFSQKQQPAYLQAVNTADSLYLAKNYKTAAANFSNAFYMCPACIRWTDKYNAASCWALAGNIDSAFANLLYVANDTNYQYYNSLIADVDLQTLHTDIRWQQISSKARTNRDRAIARPNFKLVYMLDTIYERDQGLRAKLNKLEDEYGPESKEVKLLWDTLAQTDSLNYLKIATLLDTYGWLGEDVLGYQGNSLLFLVIQHSPIAAQEKYLPMMRDAVAKGNAQASSLALLEDRIALRRGKKQLYGSQIIRDKEKQRYYVAPLEDPENVDKRRAAVGLQPIIHYARGFGIAWDIDKYLSELPYIEQLQKKLSGE